MFVQRLQIENWKNFRRGEAKLGTRLFLIGPNASGKSNFLDIFRFLRDLSVSGGGLEPAVSARGGVSKIRCLAAREYSDITIDVELKDEDDDGGLWRYRLRFNQDQNRRPIVKEELVEHNGERKLDRPDDADRNDPLRRTQTAVQQITANKDFRPVVGFFQGVSYQHVIPQVVRDPQGFSPQQITNDPFGRDFLQRVERTPKKIRDSRLRKILSVLKVAAPQLQELSVERDDLGVPHLIGLFAHWRPHAGKQNETQFSDGTLRLFGLLWSLFEGDGLLLMEEPELSLHSELVRILPQMIERINRHRKMKRQVFISTFSEEMLSDKGIGGEEVLRLEPSSEGTLLKSPLDSPEEQALLAGGLTVADVVLPKSAPADLGQLIFDFDT